MQVDLGAPPLVLHRYSKVDESAESESSAFREADINLSSRFDTRVRLILSTLLGLHFILIVVNGVIDGRLWLALEHFAMAAIAWAILRLSRDAVRIFIFSHVYWTFSFMTFAYAAVHGQTASHGLGDPEGSSLIALTSQAGLFLVFLISKSRKMFPPSHPPHRSLHRFGILEKYSYVFVGLGLAGIFADLAGALSDALTSALIPFLYVGLGVRITARSSAGRPIVDAVLVGCVAAQLFLSASNNARTDVLSVALFLAFVVLMIAPKIFSIGNIAVAYLSWRFLVTISAITLSLRWARDRSIDIAGAFFQRLFDFESLQTMINPFHIHSAELIYASTLGIQRGYSAFFGSESSLFGRMTVLPFMDVATSRMDDVSNIKWGELWNLVLSALPSVGQTKQSLIFSDVLAWDLGLRARGSVGRPMMTAEGELFFVGGHLLVFFVIPLCFLALYWFYIWMSRLTGSRALSIMISSQLFINTIFTTTALGTLIGTTRDPLQLMLVIGAVVTLGGGLGRHHNAHQLR